MLSMGLSRFAGAGLADKLGDHTGLAQSLGRGLLDEPDVVWQGYAGTDVRVAL